MGEPVVQWVDRLQEVTGWRGPRYEAEWTATEAALGTALPPDYKELFARFGPGYFSSYVYVLRDDNGGTDSLLHVWRFLFQRYERNPVRRARYFAPYEMYGSSGNRGLILWGRSEMAGRFYWLADASADPAGWPLIVRVLPDEDWLRFEMSAAEFIHRAIADPTFQPITVADPAWPPTFHPPGQ